MLTQPKEPWQVGHILVPNSGVLVETDPKSDISSRVGTVIILINHRPSLLCSAKRRRFRFTHVMKKIVLIVAWVYVH